MPGVGQWWNCRIWGFQARLSAERYSDILCSTRTLKRIHWQYH
nr:MAG TPA: hypothetical protein [Caudoviricetes sp.]